MHEEAISKLIFDIFRICGERKLRMKHEYFSNMFQKEMTFLDVLQKKRGLWSGKQ